MTKKPSMFGGRQRLGGETVAAEPPEKATSSSTPRGERVVQTTVTPDTLKKLNAIVIDEQTSLRALLREGVRHVLKERGEAITE